MIDCHPWTWISSLPIPPLVYLVELLRMLIILKFKPCCEPKLLALPEPSLRLHLPQKIIARSLAIFSPVHGFLEILSYSCPSLAARFSMHACMHAGIHTMVLFHILLHTRRNHTAHSSSISGVWTTHSSVSTLGWWSMWLWRFFVKSSIPIYIILYVRVVQRLGLGRDLLCCM